LDKNPGEDNAFSTASWLQDGRNRGNSLLRPASIELDRMADPRDTIAPGSPLRTVLKKAYQLGYHVSSLPAELGGLGFEHGKCDG
jgi:alkylation response protein AidB-like acyl-CoA dehydrogenase